MILRKNGTLRPDLVKRALDSSTAVLVIDMQEFNLQKLERYQINQKIKAQQKCLSYCRRSDIPVVALEHTIMDCSTIEKLRKYIDKVPRSIYMKKNVQDGFANPELIKQLREWNINNVFLMGVYANSCVLSTAIGAKENGLEPRSSPLVVYGPDKYTFLSDWFQKNGYLY